MENIIIIYDEFWDDYYHESDVITDLEKFVSVNLKMGKQIDFVVVDTKNSAEEWVK